MHIISYLKPQALRFYLRPIHEPFEFKCAPLYNEQLKTELLQWATKKTNFKAGTEAYRHTVECDLVQWLAFCFPSCNDLPKFKKVFHFFQMFATVDDHADESWGQASANTDETSRFWKKGITLLKTLRDETPWHIKAFRNILMRMPHIPKCMKENFKAMKTIMDELSPVQRNRYLDVFTEVMQNILMQTQMKGKEKYLAMDDYKEYRAKGCASIAITLIAEYLYGIELSDEEYKHPKLKELERLSALQSSFVNDIFSLFKEYHGSFENLNQAVSILILNKGMNLQQAIDTICDEIENFQHQFISIRDEWFANETVSNNLRCFVSGLEYYMAGSARWHRISPRYHGPHFSTVIQSGMMEAGLEGTIYTPDEDFTTGELHQAVKPATYVLTAVI